MKLAVLLVVAIALGISISLIVSIGPLSEEAKFQVLEHGVGLSDDQKDDALLAQLREHGSDLSKPTDVVFYLYIPGLEDAQAAAAQLKMHGYAPDVRAPLGKLPSGAYEARYSVVAHVEEAPSTENIKKARLLYSGLARRYHGEYDGWEAAVAH